MSYMGYSILAVIPARGGSKGIPRKNLRKVGGFSLIARAALVVKELDWIDAAIISTDDHEMAEEGNRHGLDVPFMRPDELSGDKALGVDVWRHAWLACETYYGQRFDLSIKLEPTSPLRTAEDVKLTVRTLVEGGYSSVATVSPTPAHYSPHKTLMVKENGKIDFYHAEGHKFVIRQSIPQYYHRNGICYAVTRDQIVDRISIVDSETMAVIIDRPVVNIDEPFELQLAEWLMNAKENIA